MLTESPASQTLWQGPSLATTGFALVFKSYAQVRALNERQWDILTAMAAGDPTPEYHGAGLVLKPLLVAGLIDEHGITDDGRAVLAQREALQDVDCLDAKLAVEWSTVIDHDVVLRCMPAELPALELYLKRANPWRRKHNVKLEVVTCEVINAAC